MRSFDPDVVTRLLDLVSSHFDYVVFDMPRTWFSWTDSVLLGSNKLFIVSETTVPGLRHAKQLVDADPRAARRRPASRRSSSIASSRSCSRPACAAATSSRRSATPSPACIPNDYGLVREAIDRGVPLDEIKPGNKITAQLKKLILPQGNDGKTAKETARDARARNSSCPGRDRRLCALGRQCRAS